MKEDKGSKQPASCAGCAVASASGLGVATTEVLKQLTGVTSPAVSEAEILRGARAFNAHFGADKKK